MFFFWWRSSRHFVCRFILDGMVKEILTRGWVRMTGKLLQRLSLSRKAQLHSIGCERIVEISGIGNHSAILVICSE